MRCFTLCVSYVDQAKASVSSPPASSSVQRDVEDGPEDHDAAAARQLQDELEGDILQALEGKAVDAAVEADLVQGEVDGNNGSEGQIVVGEEEEEVLEDSAVEEAHGEEADVGGMAVQADASSPIENSLPEIDSDDGVDDELFRDMMSVYEDTYQTSSGPGYGEDGGFQLLVAWNGTTEVSVTRSEV